jgi:SpoIID/LytB domain protein
MATTAARAVAALVTLAALGGAALTQTPSVAAAPVAAVSTGSVSITGSGFGHGVGMSQYGALGMARAGSTAKQIVSYFFTGVAVAPVRDATDIRVNVVHRGRSVILRPIAVGAGAGNHVRLVSRLGTTLSLGVGDQASVTPSGSGLSVGVRRVSGATSRFWSNGLSVQWSGTGAQSGPPTRLAVSSFAAGSLTVKERSYRWGRLWLSNVGGGIEAVATVDIHSGYLRGLAEMPSSWPAAALGAQVIAARSYAVVAAAKSPQSSCGGCQVWDDERSQMYVGWAKEGERIGSVDYGARWVAAVTATSSSATSGVAVLYHGMPVQTFYASSTGGRTRDPKAVWGSSVPYLRSVADPWSLSNAVNPGYAVWTRTPSVSRLAGVFGLADLASVKVTARDSAGAATVVTATSGAGVARAVKGETFRSRLGLPSAWVSSVTLPTP